MSDTKEGWGVLRPGDRKHHYYVDQFSLCRRVGFYRGELDPNEGAKGPDDCAACWKALQRRLNPPPVRVTDKQADLLEWMDTSGPAQPADHLTLSNLNKKGLVEYRSNADNTGSSWEVTDEGKRAWRAAADKISTASRKHHFDTGRYLKRGDAVSDSAQRGERED